MSAGSAAQDIAAAPPAAGAGMRWGRPWLYQRDYPLTQSTILFVAVMFMAINLLVDMLYAYLDPRIRYST